MPAGNYALTPEADRDLDEIVRHTFWTWGERQARRYQAALLEGCAGLAEKGSHRGFSPKTPGVFFRRCQHHYLFYQRTKPVRIIAILHEKSELLARLKTRL